MATGRWPLERRARIENENLAQSFSDRVFLWKSLRVVDVNNMCDCESECVVLLCLSLPCLAPTYILSTLCIYISYGLVQSVCLHTLADPLLLRVSAPLQLGSTDSTWSFYALGGMKSLRVVDVRAFGSWISAPKCLFFQDLERPDRSFGSGYPRE